MILIGGMYGASPELFRDGIFYSSRLKAFLHSYENISASRKLAYRQRGEAVHVMFHPSGSKTASQPNTLGPLAGTIVPSVRPSKINGSVPEFKCIFEREIRAEMG